MRKTSFEYHIHGYRYAPESFHIYKGLPGQEKTELPLSDEQRYQMGYLYLTQGIKSAVDYVKHIERERERKCRLYMTYGFMLKENPRSYVYCADPAMQGERPAGGAPADPARIPGASGPERRPY